MKRFCTRFIFLSLCGLTAYGQTLFRLGVNLDADGAFVNIVNHTNRYSNAAGYDSLGWPTGDFDLVLLDGRPVAEWAGGIDDPERYRVDYSGRYACGFTGSAVVQASGSSVSIENFSYDHQSNISTFDLVIGGYPDANHGLVFLKFGNTRRKPPDPSNSGITGLKVHRPGYPLNTTKVFTDEYVSLCTAADFACYRYYNVQNIWEGEPAYPNRTRWEMRKTPLDASQTSMANTSGKRDGWCWEYTVELSNMLRKDIWICLHLSCDSTYVVTLAEYLKRELHPDVNIYVESSNEVWSPSQATHGPYNQADAQARGLTFDQNHARRTVELSRWFAEVFGENEINSRIRVILAGQHGYHGRSDNHLQYINNVFGPPEKFIYASSTALYFGSDNASSPDTSAIIGGMNSDIDGQILDNNASTYRRNHINKARDWRLPGGCTSYEGGPHLPAGGGVANLASQIRAHRTYAMADVLKRNFLEGWRDPGGGLAMYFTLASGYNRYGCWGITDDPSKPDRNFKMSAVRDIIGVSQTGAVEPDNPAENRIIEVYPNPFTDRIRLRIEKSAGIRISDMLGRVIWRGELQQGCAVIECSTWLPGMYVISRDRMKARIIKR